MADIYLARAQTGMGAARLVVVKQILKELGGDPHFAKMLIDEAKLVAGLRHANVVQVLDLGREEDRLYIAMEYVEGFDLNQLLRQLSARRIALPAEFALFVVREMLASLDFAHRAKGGDGAPLGIVHRDVSPSNVLISFEGEVKLCDFGIAKALGGSPAEPAIDEGRVARAASETEPGEGGSGERSRIAGKAAYMSPEHARGDEIDARADIFSAGIVLFELCAGRRLYKGTEARMLELAREGAVPPLPERGIPRQVELQKILDRALGFDPDARFASATAMLRALDEYMFESKLVASQLRFGAFLSEHFEADVVRTRRERERAAEALELGPPVEIVPLEPVGEEAASAPLEEPVEEPSARSANERAVPPDAAELGIANENTRRLPAVQVDDARPAMGILIALGIGILAMLAVLVYLATR
jgi:serine/threonine-protein kinase